MDGHMPITRFHLINLTFVWNLSREVALHSVKRPQTLLCECLYVHVKIKPLGFAESMKSMFSNMKKPTRTRLCSMIIDMNCSNKYIDV